MLINMPIMQTRSFVCLLPMRTCRAMADWCSSTTVFATVSKRSAVGQRGPWVSQMFPPHEKSPHVKFMLVAGDYSWHL